MKDNRTVNQPMRPSRDRGQSPGGPALAGRPAAREFHSYTSGGGLGWVRAATPPSADAQAGHGPVRW